MGCKVQPGAELPLQLGESRKDPTELQAGSQLDTGSRARSVDERGARLGPPEERSAACSGTDSKAGSGTHDSSFCSS